MKTIVNILVSRSRSISSRRDILMTNVFVNK